MAIQWMTLSGEFINETSAGGIQWMSLGGEFIVEQAATGGGGTTVGIGLTNSVLLEGGAGGRKLAE
jgi:hypothetical protein